MAKIKGEGSYKFLRPLVKLYFKLKYHPTVYGGENIPKEGPIVVCGNHRHTHDQFNVMIVTKRVIHYMAKDEYFKGHFAWFFKGNYLVLLSKKRILFLIFAIFFFAKAKWHSSRVS